MIRIWSVIVDIMVEEYRLMLHETTPKLSDIDLDSLVLCERVRLNVIRLKQMWKVQNV